MQKRDDEMAAALIKPQIDLPLGELGEGETLALQPGQQGDTRGDLGADAMGAARGEPATGGVAAGLAQQRPGGAAPHGADAA